MVLPDFSFHKCVENRVDLLGYILNSDRVSILNDYNEYGGDSNDLTIAVSSTDFPDKK